MSRQYWKVKHSVAVAVCLCFISYFCFHSLSGNRGFFAYLKLSRESEAVKKELELARIERLYLENKVNNLKPGSLDLDLLDEQVRRNLGYACPNEIIYLSKDPSSDEN